MADWLIRMGGREFRNFRNLVALFTLVQENAIHVLYTCVLPAVNMLRSARHFVAQDMHV